MELSLRARLRAGDPDAFGVLYDECANAVYNYAFRLTGDWSTAEEVASLTFLEAWRLRGKVELDGGPLLPWLLGIASNVTRNVSRAARRHRAAVLRLPVPSSVPDFADELAGRIDDAAQLREVCQALAGLGYAGAAKALGVPVGTVRSRLSRARRKLQRLVGEPGPGGGTGQGGGRESGAGCEQVQVTREHRPGR
jgi:DNA-directed RNA polymerase specialized sigma24 family protein